MAIVALQEKIKNPVVQATRGAAINKGDRAAGYLSGIKINKKNHVGKKR